MNSIIKNNIPTALAGLFFSLLFWGCSNDIDQPDEQPSTKPGIRDVSPRQAIPGNHVIIKGVNFGDNQQAIDVMFDDVEAEIVDYTPGRIEAVVPAENEAGYAKIQLQVAGEPSNQYYFTFGFSQPTIDSLTAARIGEPVDIMGSGFGNMEEHAVVTFGEQPVDIVSIADTLIQVVAPALDGSTVLDVQVTIGEQQLSNVVSFSYLNNLYSNPVVAQSLPDPTLIKAEDGFFYLYATEDIRNTPIMRSADLVNWEQVGTAFTEDTRPTFEPGGGLWAPDIRYIDGQYVLYYSMSVWGGEWTCGIGAATASNPAGPFTDHGPLFRSEDIDVQNSIDPCFIEDNGRNYMMWGSFRGIYLIELSDDGLSVKPGAEKQQVAGTYFEGVNIHKRGEYYYMFASIGSCCAGLNSTYQLVVGRATNLAGPYYNRSGFDMMNNGRTLVIDKNDTFVGNGHGSQLVQDDEGKDWLLYHGVRTSDPSGRVLLLDQIQWDDEGWPYIEGGSPSTAALAPTFNP